MSNTKDYISFFKRDINMTNDSRMRKVLRRHGGLAVAVYEEVLAMVYETGSYFLPWLDDYALDIADRLYEPDQEKIRQIIEMLIEVGLFSKEYFEEYGVITSFGIQKRYSERGDRSHRRREIHEYAIPDTSTARVCAEVRVSARLCAEVREPARDCAEMRSRDRDRAIDRAIDPPPTPPLVGNDGGNGGDVGGNGGDDEIVDVDSKPSLSPTIQTYPAKSSPNALPGKNNPNTPPRATSDSRGIFEPSGEDPENAPITQVIKLWNDAFKGTSAEYTYFYPSAIISEGIQRRLRLTPELETFKKVFAYARKEFEGKGIDNHQFVWTLSGVFNRQETFDHLLAKATAPTPASKRTSPRGAPALTASDYDNDPW